MHPIRCQQRLAIALIALTMGSFLVVGLVAGGLAAIILGRQLIPVVFGLGFIALGVFFAYQMMENFSWVELDGSTLRGQRFWTRVIVEHELQDITKIVPMVAPVHNLQSSVTNAMLGSIRGYVIEFNSGPRLVVLNGDMKGVEPLMHALQQAVGARWNQLYVEPKS